MKANSKRVRAAKQTAIIKGICDRYMEGYLEHCNLQILLVLHEEFGFGAGRLERFMHRYREMYREMHDRYIAVEEDWGPDPDDPYRGSTHSRAMKRKLLEYVGLDYDAVVARLDREK